MSVVVTRDDGTKVIVRLSPFDAESLQENAEDTFADEEEEGLARPRYGVSVLATALPTSETVDDAVARIVETTTLTGRKMSVLVTSQLTEKGFVLAQDANELEPDHHLIGDGDMQDLPRVQELESLFNLDIRRFPKKKKKAPTA